MSKFSAPFHETKEFTILEPGSIEPLRDQDGKPFTVTLYAPQSDYMQDFDENAAQRSLMKNMRTNGKAAQNIKANIKAGAVRLAHAIKEWHPVSPDGEAITESELPFKEEAIAAVLADREVRWWLTDQLSDFFDKNNFVVTKEEAAELEKAKKPAKKTEPTSA